MSLIYILREDGQQVAHEESEISNLIARRALSLENLFWKEGMSDWRPLSELASRGTSFVPPKRTTHYGPDPETAVRPFQAAASQAQPTPARQDPTPEAVAQSARRKAARYRLRFNLLPLTISMQILFACLMCAAALFIYQCLDKINNGSAGAPPDPLAVLTGSANTSGAGNAGVSIADRNFMIYFFCGLVAVHFVGEILFFFWIYYANKNCRGMASNIIYTPNHAVACFFIPILNLFRPYSVVQELWKVSANPRGWMGRRGSFFVGLWFFVRLSLIVLSRGPTLAGYGESDDPRIRAIGILLYLATVEGILVLIELTTIILVSVITWRQIKWAKVAARAAG